ncbi:MAG: DEAD/DEAH box helicase family protein, partial [Endozoicomonadaceae bacterium]|nr:DEAD/DEAH box helicase family protein [Endozoicomonadaceae bacterium]
MSESKKQHKLLIDNVGIKLHEYLKDKINHTSSLRFVSAYFTIYGFEVIKEKLKQATQVKFLYGDPQSVEYVDPENIHPKAFKIADENKLELKNILYQKPLAQECSDWVKRDNVAIRSVKSNFLHGKMYSIANEGDQKHSAVGSSNLTKNGLGAGKGSNVELNMVTEGEKCGELEEWFDQLWTDENKTIDVKQEVLDSLSRLYGDYSPEFVYYKTLYEIFKDRLAEYEENQKEYQRTKFNKTKIYEKLYSFQREAVSSLIYKLEKYNGCILADSVGLGKTFTALAVIKYYELKNKNVLVLCPKKLSENWKVYANVANKNNQFARDKFSYKVLNHTDLSRTDKEDNFFGTSGDIDLANFNWSIFDLIVIDESHNFRNSTPGKIDKDTEIKKKSRYEHLLEDIIIDGSQTKVMMLSATPINNSSRDLRNQLYLMGGKNQDHFKETLGISNLEDFFRQKETIFKRWLKDKSVNKNKDDLYEKLGGDFFDLIASVTLARSRKQIAKLYQQDMKKIGDFPKRQRPINRTPHTDTLEKVSYKDLNEQIKSLNFAIYNPTKYLHPDSETRKDLEGKGAFKQTDREEALIGMMRINFLKRLESSGHSFIITINKVMDKVKGMLKVIAKFKGNQQQMMEISTEYEEDEEDKDAREYSSVGEDEDFVVGKLNINLSEMLITKWEKALKEDYDILEKMHDSVKEVVDNDRDAKLIKLKEDISKKLDNPTQNKNGEECRKLLIFTVFSDTAKYLYDKVIEDANYKKYHIGLVTGTSSSSTRELNDINIILNHFAPKGRANSGNCPPDSIDPEDEIDILIATDCISEGQNLPDCDWVINYDIHWNPARLLQRFGRVDRLESPHSEIQVINYWPTDELEEYLNLADRVNGKMALIDASSTLDNDLLAADETQDTLEKEISRVNSQLAKMRNGTMDFDDEYDEISLLDFSIDNFIALLWQYLTQNRKMLENAENGLYAVTNNKIPADQSKNQHNFPEPGIIFCIKQRDENKEKDQQTAGMR